MDAVKEFGIRSKDGSKTSADAYKLLGLNATEMTKRFAQGGPVAQKAWQEVGSALKNLNDPVKQNAAAVGLFGTQAEDLEIKTILALTNARSQFDMTKNTMEEVKKIKYNDIGTAFKTIGRQLSTSLIIPIADAMLPALSAFSNWFNEAAPKVKSFLSSFGKNAVTNIMDLLGFGGEDGVKDIGDTMKELKIQFLAGATPIISAAKTTFQPLMTSIMGFIGPLATFGKSTFATLSSAISATAGIVKTYLYPTFSMVFGYIVGTLLPLVISAIQSWLPKISALIAAIVPLFMAIYNNGIAPLIQAFQYAWPIISTVISTAVNIIKPLIGGIIDVLTGVITFLTGVFTGNWSQAWEGLKTIATGIWEGITGAVKAAFNGVIKIINQAIGKINGVSFELPEWAGGGTFGGLGIPEIPEFARGGITNQPSIFGEAGPEIAIPVNNGARSQNLLDMANRMIGRRNEPQQGMNVTYAPVFQISGNADKSALEEVSQAGYDQFIGFMGRMQQDKKRRSL